MDPELLGKLFGFLGTLVSLGSNLVGAINLKAPKDSGDTEQSSAAEPLRTFGRRAAAFCSSASQSFKGMTPQGRFGTSVGVSLLFFCSAFIGLGLNQFAAQFLPLINLVAKLIAGLPGITALNEGQSSSFIVVAALLVLGALIFFGPCPAHYGGAVLQRNRGKCVRWIQYRARTSHQAENGCGYHLGYSVSGCLVWNRSGSSKARFCNDIRGGLGSSPSVDWAPCFWCLRLSDRQILPLVGHKESCRSWYCAIDLFSRLKRT